MKRAAWLLVPLLLFLLAGLSGRHLANLRQAEGIPMSAARVPLGGFEPLAVSFLWLRAGEQREAGALPEAVASYRLLTELSPRVGPAWALPAHLLVFTKSADEDPEVQWRWIREGLALLDRGLQLNPDDPVILQDLALAYYQRIAPDPAIRKIAIRELGRMPEALAVETFRRLNRVAPSTLADAFLVDAIRQYGDARYDAGNFDEALAAYEEVLPRLMAAAASPDRLPEEVERMRRRVRKLRARTKGE